MCGEVDVWFVEFVGAELEVLGGEGAWAVLLYFFGSDVERIGGVGQGQSHGGVEDEGLLAGEVVVEALGGDSVVSGVEEDVAFEVDGGDDLAEDVLGLDAVGFVGELLDFGL